MGHRLVRAVPDTAPESQQLELAQSFLAYLSYVGELIDERAQQPREDFVTELVVGPADGGGLKRGEILELTASILLGDNDTVAGLLSSVILRLRQDHSRSEALADDPARMPHSIEEGLRYDGAKPE